MKTRWLMVVTWALTSCGEPRLAPPAAARVERLAELPSKPSCESDACVRRPLQEGDVCAPATPCRAKGRWHAGVCVLPEETELQPVWSSTAAQYGEWAGFVDAGGHSYEEWPDYLHYNVVVTERDRDGAVIARTTVADADFDHPRLVSNGRLLVPKHDRFIAYRTGDLAQAWDRRESGTWSWGDVATDGGDNLLVHVTRPRTYRPQESLLSLSLRDGHVRWEFVADPSPDSPWGSGPNEKGPVVFDANGNLYSQTTKASCIPRPCTDLLSLDGGGKVRWRRTIEDYAATPIAVSGSRVIVRGDQVLFAVSTDTGAELWRVAESEMEWGILLSPERRGYFVRGYGHPVLVAFDQDTGKLEWKRPESDRSVQLLGVTDRDAVLYLSTETICGPSNCDLYEDDTTYVTQLIEVSSNGEEVFRCKLPAAKYWPIGIHQSRLFLREGMRTLHAFDVPGLALAPKGWAVPRGTPSHEMRAR